MKYLILILVGTSLTLANFAGTKPVISVTATNRPNDRFVGNRYYDPAGMFSVVIPETYRDQLQENTAHKNGKAQLLFGNDLLRIAVSLHIETFLQSEEMNLYQTDKDAAASLVKYLYHQATLPSFRQSHGRQFEIVHEESLLTDTKGPAYLGIVCMPNRFSSISHNGSEKSLDKYMGHLLFLDGDQLVVLACDFPKAGSHDETVVLIRTMLQQTQRSYRNEKGNPKPPVTKGQNK